MNRKTVEVLISTMNRKDLSFLQGMNLRTDSVIGNQNGKDGLKEETFNGHKCTIIASSNKGLSKNRNLTIQNANGDICLLADDDVSLVDGYEKIISHAFDKYENADIIVFNLLEEPIERYVIKKDHRVKGLEFLRYGSVRIAFKRESVKNNIFFDEEFGAGGDIPIGEDTIFLSDCLKGHLVIEAVSEYIVKLNPSVSTWFNGYNDQYFINKGKMYYRIFGYLYLIMSLQDVFRHRRRYGSGRRWFKNMCLMIQGANEYKKAHKGIKKC